LDARDIIRLDITPYLPNDYKIFLMLFIITIAKLIFEYNTCVMRLIICISLAAFILFGTGCISAPRYLPHKVIPQRSGAVALPDNESLLGTINYYIGTPYKIGGEDKSGIDCSSFTRVVFKDALDVELPRTCAEQWKAGKPVDRDEMAFGDIVFFKKTKKGDPSHCGIYIGGGRFAHSSSSLGVTVTPLSDSYWSGKYTGCRRFIKR
jgi:hypothetical protein